ncbi:MAG TPA: tryptophan synthase subunit alpha [Salinimicrobium sp.]|nr:tryptophan synthase subunit alpha [Salinimicrobium sp.]
MQGLNQIFRQNKKLLSIYFTAGFPNINDTIPIILELEKSGVDFIEIGLPFSDPLADGPTIQKSSEQALKNGMSSKILFQQLEEIKGKVSIPLIIMGYFNPILQFGVEEFCEKCQQTGIVGLIIPDLPVEEYEEHYREIFEKYRLTAIFLITSQTSEERIRFIDSVSESFIYLVSSAGVTGNTSDFGEDQKDYFRRISKMKLNSPLVAGFGIHDSESFKNATQFTKGAIIGSAFIKHLSKNGIGEIRNFTHRIK